MITVIAYRQSCLEKSTEEWFFSLILISLLGPSGSLHVGYEESLSVSSERNSLRFSVYLINQINFISFSQGCSESKSKFFSQQKAPNNDTRKILLI